MRKLVCIGQGAFGVALLEAAKDITQSDQEAWGIDGTSRDEFRKHLYDLAASLHKGERLLILADSACSAMVKEAMLVLEKTSHLQDTLILAGANVPMAVAALELMNAVDDDPSLVNMLKAEANSGILPLA